MELEPTPIPTPLCRRGPSLGSVVCIFDGTYGWSHSTKPTFAFLLKASDFCHRTISGRHNFHKQSTTKCSARFVSHQRALDVTCHLKYQMIELFCTQFSIVPKFPHIHSLMNSYISFRNTTNCTTYHLSVATPQHAHHPKHHPPLNSPHQIICSKKNTIPLLFLKNPRHLIHTISLRLCNQTGVHQTIPPPLFICSKTALSPTLRTAACAIRNPSP